MIKTILVERGEDDFGSGAFGASRGNRQHNGTDYLASDGQKIFALRVGVVSKIGYCYNDDLSFRYVEVSTGDLCKERYFYVRPEVLIGDVVSEHTVLGTCYSLQSRYPGIKDHIHFEVKRDDGSFINPDMYFQGYR
jgi:hypothetical protein